ncbi:MAG: hypothetical protein MUF52_06645 [Syntrophobacteraceae bacterium]|jgi:hypothetical protein|nr:hypothetical protein [Syntrophobacteraceae bacterium]
MKDKRSFHLKVQEMCDCYLNTEPLREMSVLKNEEDKDDAALKWLALAILYGIDSHAKSIALSSDEDGGMKVVAKFRKSELPSPGKEVGKKIFDVVKEIGHFDGDEGETSLAVGIRDSSLELQLKAEKDDDGQTVVLKFPK